MPVDHFEEIQKAVDIVNTSAHPDNKIAATLAGNDNGKPFSLSRTNYWPESIRKNFGLHTRIGNSSGTIHAETTCLLAATRAEGASLYITDPFCPNCAKNVAEAGVRAIYIDHKGFDKDFAARRGHHFDSMSMQICEKAGISVYEIRRKERRIEPILEIPDTYRPAQDSPVEIEEMKNTGEETFRDLVALKRKEHKGRRIAAALARDKKGKAWGLTARAHPAIGYSMTADADEIEHPREGKYTFILEPVNRLLMNAARQGLKLVDGLVFSSGVPTAREQVNLVGAGLKDIQVGDPLKARDEDAFQAMELLAKAEILSFRRFS